MKPFLLCLSTCIAVPASLADNWPAWRGPDGTGVCVEKSLPLHWDRTQNVKWRIPLPERGNSTPIVWGQRLFLTQALEKDGQRLVMCFDRENGHLHWQRGPSGVPKEVTHETNPYCSGSPVTDGERVIAFFGSAGVWCFDFEGKEVWHRELGKQEHVWGGGTSPCLHGNLYFVNFGPGENTALFALDKKTGATVWKHEEPGGKFGHSQKDWLGSWSTPVVVRPAGRDELIMTYPGRVVAFDPATGKELWTCRGLNPLVYTSPLHADGVIVAMGGFGGSMLAVKPGGSGDVTESHRLWHVPKSRQRIGSGVVAGDHIFILDDPGIAECVELKTGKPLWEERLKGPGKTGQSWGSMVLAGDKIYVVNQGGDSFVLNAGPKFEVLATNPLGETTMSSPAISNGEIFIRTHEALWCIRDKARETQ
ncbi:MAG: PQQ-binding-like beta-propeller repeat protein [Verrucomicrobiales bacterium]